MNMTGVVTEPAKQVVRGPLRKVAGDDFVAMRDVLVIAASTLAGC